MTKAFSYIRFSKKIQSLGDSERRQTDIAKEYADKNNLELDESSFSDLGISGWNSSSKRQGLEDMFTAIDSGAIPRDSHIVIEAIDRLSRQPIKETNKMIYRIIESGVKLYIAADNILLDETSINDISNVLILAIKCDLAFQESQQKSDRIRKTFKNTRDNSLIKPKKCPFWLEFNGTEYVFSDKKWILDLILEMKQTLSLNEIARQLNHRDIPTRTGAKWKHTTIGQILRHEALYGCWRDKDDTLHLDYYPAVMTLDEFTQLNPRQRAKGKVSRDNHFRALLKCTCGSSIIKRRNGKWNYFHCSDAKTLKTCNARPIRAEILEKWIFIACRQMKHITVPTKQNDNIQQEIRKHEIALEQLQKAINSGVVSDVIIKGIQENEAKIKELQDSIIQEDDVTGDNIKMLNDLRNNPVEWNSFAQRFISRIEAWIEDGQEDKLFTIDVHQNNGHVIKIRQFGKC
ncbi:recombinase family protein [Vibrio rotiferianus]|uniref:recombinase family protein n=1 Tax=Vibrio rotiferianus TaxID=190895 RepID=UPI003394E55A